MNIRDLSRVGLRFELQKTGDSRWVRAFVHRSDGCTVGRLSFFQGELYNHKWYKDKLCFVEFDESDFVQAQFEHYLSTGERLGRTQYQELVTTVKQQCAEDLAEKLAWRAANPKSGRPKLTGRDPRRVFHHLMLYPENS